MITYTIASEQTLEVTILTVGVKKKLICPVCSNTTGLEQRLNGHSMNDMFLSHSNPFIGKRNHWQASATDLEHTIKSGCCNHVF